MPYVTQGTTAYQDYTLKGNGYKPSNVKTSKPIPNTDNVSLYNLGLPIKSCNLSSFQIFTWCHRKLSLLIFTIYTLKTKVLNQPFNNNNNNNAYRYIALYTKFSKRFTNLRSNIITHENLIKYKYNSVKHKNKNIKITQGAVQF